MQTTSVWQRSDYTRVPFGVYHDPVVGANTSVIHDRIRRGNSADAVRMPDFVIDPNASVTQCAGVAPYSQSGALSICINRAIPTLVCGACAAQNTGPAQLIGHRIAR